MPRRTPNAPSADSELGLLRGTLDLFILKTLSWGPMHGLAILQWIERTTRQRLQIEEGALYPALHRMEDKGWLDAEWGHTDVGRRAKFYRLTPDGRRQLSNTIIKWNQYAEAAALILSAKGVTP
ncbi:MAG TPA: PadR family transcriptional regulator [Gemmatimonadaceae bacterium]|jgi:transcriptional regulator